MTINCSTCGHWQSGAEQQMGICRRNAPITIAAWAPQADLLKTVWPSTQPNDYCGEHRPLKGITVKNLDTEGLA